MRFLFSRQTKNRPLWYNLFIQIKNNFIFMQEIKNFSALLGITGMSEALLNNHFKLYEGYVNNVNALEKLLKSAELGAVEKSELRRRYAWEWNGMRLHELYFENLSKETGAVSESLRSALAEGWGTFENWEKDFRSVGAMRGIGWVVLAFDKVTKTYQNIWINEHDVGHLCGALPILVMDVFEHAFMLDYGLKRADYIESFMKNIDWAVVEKRVG